MGYHIYAIEKAIRPLFADRVTNTLTHSDFISKCTNYIYNVYIMSSLYYYELLHIFITCQLIPTG